MTGLETVLLRVAGTAAGTLVKSLLARAPGAGLTADPARPAPRWRKPPAELGDGEMRRLTEALAERLGPEAAALPEHERLAALDAVGDAFAALGPLDAESLFAADLDPAALAAAVPPPPAGLNEAAEALYGRLVRLCCAHAVEYVTTLPGFGARADVELVRRTGELARAVNRLADRPEGASYAFEERYARYVAETHGRLRLFGLTLSRSRQEWPLDVAYISLAVSGEQQLMPGEPELRQTQLRAEQALASADRVLLRGPAGSGKSTLVQWLALTAARQAEGSWGTCVPFVLRLRAFTSAESLPLPEEFLRASGVPLSAPAGWVEDLMLSGRALVLVDGVDEVPQRLRARTETWLRSLISAFPKARYVVTTRPSAVPEDWLAGQGFAPHSMLPMEQQDIRAFVAHWHAAARAEGQELDAYEASLLEAVSSRRDLARLATNPLMCALLCALNQDRRMQLPRARKELYDAALDMLLVRRDTEREICGVEGVYLTREEQVALLQRFAYWLIRNGQLEAGRDEAVEMVGEWLDAMPQVRAQGGAEQVFAHLLIRSGLLLEPSPGSVTFVHRTFQDYLGAKAAVESRDFGVLVKNAQDDSWDDVVRMAVGHARPDERLRILRGLLRRADKVKSAHDRLVLLAAASLQHAPELDPVVHADIQSRTAGLLPPRTPQEAEQLAKAGELVLDLLPRPEGLAEAEAAACLRTAALVGSPRALGAVARFRHDTRSAVCRELSRSWGAFDARLYADEVLADASLGDAVLEVRSPEQVAALAGLPHIRKLYISEAEGIPDVLESQRQLEALTLYRSGVTGLDALTRHQGLRYLGLFTCLQLSGLEPLTGLPVLDSLTLAEVPRDLDLAPLADLRALTELALNYGLRAAGVSAVPAPKTLTRLGLFSPDIGLDSLDRWPELDWMTVTGDRQFAELTALLPLPRLRTLQLVEQADLDLSPLLDQPQLVELALVQCHCRDGLAALSGLPRLRNLILSGVGVSYDVTPLAGLDQLDIVMTDWAEVRGLDRIPPERIRRLGAF
ncbi:NACHT domain-containing protein [Streptomyces sp. NRRL S-448]|uniref:NACHT domain-containing protein n=1 Tax=Streptomyces sp. NRRL S-448 TaxID=1463907 RepID=UPI0035664B0A